MDFIHFDSVIKCVFILWSDSLKKALVPHGTSKALTEAAAVTAVKLCKVSTYIHFLDSGNVVFALVQTVLNDLKVSRPAIARVRWRLNRDLACGYRHAGVAVQSVQAVLPRSGLHEPGH